MKKLQLSKLKGNLKTKKCCFFLTQVLRCVTFYGIVIFKYFFKFLDKIT